MSERIASAFANGKAFLPFITCGDPSLEVTEELVYAMGEAGADLVVLGIPFSDPTAEGPVIQAANVRALSGGATVDRIFGMVERIRMHRQIPLAFMTYANVAFSYRQKGRQGLGGTEAFIGRAASVGIDALILTDVPFEERGEFAPACQKNGIALVPLLAPASEERVSRIAGEAEGFVYCVPAPGIRLAKGLEVLAAQVKRERGIPCVADAGASREEAQVLASLADGVIGGTAIVKYCETYGAGCIPYVRDYVKEMKEAIQAG